MTGWMIYSNGGFPVAHADTLISARVGVDIGDQLPTTKTYDEKNQIIKNECTEFVTTGMCQKIVIISKRVVYIWAGPLRIATELDAELRALELEGCLYDAKVVNRISKKFGVYKDFSALIWICYHYPESMMVRVNAELLDIPDFGSVVFGGWGEGEFYALTYHLQGTLDPRIALEKYDLGEIEKSESDSYVRMRLLDGLLQYRVFTDQFRHVATGGAIETIALYPEGFRKMGDYLYAIFFDEDFDNVGMIPRILIKRTYAHGYLGVSVLDYGLGEFKSFTVPSPHNRCMPFHILPDIHDPWKGDLAGVCCIFIRKNGTRSYLNEDPKVFRSNCYLDPHLNRPVVSEWYTNDMKSKRSPGR